jgi:hypothetical protein
LGRSIAGWSEGDRDRGEGARRRRESENGLGDEELLDRIRDGLEELVTLQLMPEPAIDEAQGYELGPPESVESLLGATV